jgi:uncharacterized delta-60 repeat protein
MRRFTAGVLVALALAVPPLAAAAPGDPDPTFGAGGGTLTPVGAAHAYAAAVAIQPDGGIVVGGESYDGRGGFPLTLVRYSAGGVLDPDFGRAGVAMASGAGLAAVAVAPTGQIVAAGYRSRAGGRRPLLARFTSRGALEGQTSEQVGDGDAVARALVVAPDGAVLMASDARRGGDAVIAVSRYLPDGSLDRAFGSGGTTFVVLPGRSLTTVGMARDPSGRVVVAGTAYDPLGSGSEPVLARLLPGGAPDRGFGGGTPIPLPTGLASAAARGLALDPTGGSIVAVSGRAPLRSELAAVRAGPDGSADESFGIGAVATAPLHDSDTFASAVAVDRDGAIVLAGTAGDEPALVRLEPGGDLDPTSASPSGLFSFPGSNMRPAALAIDPGGRLVLAGSAFAGGREQIAIVRLEGVPLPIPPAIPTG